eukprot:572362-Karenia_brevis.AAC.1
MASTASGDPPLEKDPMVVEEEESNAAPKRTEPEIKEQKDVAEIAAEVIAASRSAYYAAEKNDMMKSEATLQAENDQAVLMHKKKNESKEEDPKAVQASKRKFEMPKRPEQGDHEGWAAIDMMVRNKHGNLAQQTEALEKTIPKERRLRWMAQ